MYVCVSVHMFMSTCQKRAPDPLELGLQTIVSCLTWCWELNSGPLQEQYVLLSAESQVCVCLRLIFMCTNVLYECMYVYHVHAVLIEATRGR